MVSTRAFDRLPYATSVSDLPKGSRFIKHLRKEKKSGLRWRIFFAIPRNYFGGPAGR
jgi:hypothetical protein